MNNSLTYSEIDAAEIYDLIKDIKDPEHPLSLSELNVVNLEDLVVDAEHNSVTIWWTPTIPKCSMALIIGLSISSKLRRCLPMSWRMRILCKEGTHENELELNKQINDKERATAAIENPNLLKLINQCINV